MNTAHYIRHIRVTFPLYLSRNIGMLNALLQVTHHHQVLGLVPPTEVKTIACTTEVYSRPFADCLEVYYEKH